MRVWQIIREEIMKTHYTVALSMLAGVALGAAAIQGLHAQAKPPIYYVADVEVTNPEGYLKEYVPLVQASLKAAGGRLLATGGPAGAKMTAIEGAVPQGRVALQVWDSMEKIQAWRNSAAYIDSPKIGVKYAKFRAYTIEGLQ